ncbi:MAG: hypothetical protein Q8N77_00780 [Nanoarchaeota archaeon]|nr:hypothetical protein [Nanoarchaeota archaeon]
MLEKEVVKGNLWKIKKQVHTAISETAPLGVADKFLINKVIDELYKKNSGYNIPVQSFLAMVEAELSRYKF